MINDINPISRLSVETWAAFPIQLNDASDIKELMLF